MKIMTRMENRLSANDSISISDFRIAVVLVFVILNLAVFSIRLISVWHYGTLFVTTAGEPLVIYPVWKAIHHLTVYEWPLSYPFSLALYNYLFYDTYAFFLRLVGAGGINIMTWGRMFTPIFAIIGAIAQWKLVQTHLNLHGLHSLLSFILAVGLWVCTSIVGHWALTIRPDLAAVAFVMVALWMVVRQLRFSFVYAGILFYFAWSFKQSVVLAFVGVSIFLLLHKRWCDLSLLVTIFAALAGITLILGTPEYRFNILVAPRVVKNFSIMWALPVAAKSLAVNAYWLLAPIVLLLAAETRRVNNTIRLLTTVLVVALIGGLAGMTKVGSGDHYLLEAFAAGSTLLQIAVFTAPSWLISALLSFGCILPAIQTATVPSGSGEHPHKFGTVGIATASEYADAEFLRDRLELMKKPIFTNNEIYSLPWISTDNCAPALVIDNIYHEATKASCQNGCVEGMLQRGEIPTVMLRSSNHVKSVGSLIPDYDKSYQDSLRFHYIKVAEARESGGLWDIYVLKANAQSNELIN